MNTEDRLTHSATRPNRGTLAFWRTGRALLTVAYLAIFGADAAIADRSDLQVINNAPLRFGTFAVPTSGYREISASGAITSSGIFVINDSGAGPARFTVQYDRGNNSRKSITVSVELVFSAAPVFRNGGLVANLTRYQTDLPGYGVIDAGQPVRIELRNCITRVCATSFQVGGRLDVVRSFGGGMVDIPIPIDAVAVEVR